jgi:hypothetical protein
MSYIRQTVYVDKYSDLPSVGAFGVMYIVRTKVTGTVTPPPPPPPPLGDDSSYYIVKGWFWNGSGYEEIVDSSLIQHSLYSNTLFPDLTTIKKALDFLLAQDLAVIFTVMPQQVNQAGTYSVTFTWNLSKKVSEIEAIYIEDITDTVANVIETNLTAKTTVTFGSTVKSMQINSQRVFRITVEDSDGNVVTATQTIAYDLNRVLIDTFTVDPTLWAEDPVNNTVSLEFEWALSMDKEYASGLVLYERNVGGEGWTEIDTSLLDDTATDGTGSKAISRGITSSKEYKLTVSSLSGALPDSSEVAVVYEPYVDITLSALTIAPATSTGSPEDYVFSATTNKTPTEIRLYQLDGVGGNIVDGDDPDNVLNTLAGQNYVSISPSGTTISEVLNLAITENVYFQLKVLDEDAKGNTSFAQSENHVTYESTLIFVGDLDMLPTTYYYGQAFNADLNVLFNENLTQTVYDDITGLLLRFSPVSGLPGSAIDIGMTPKSTYIGVGSNQLDGTLAIGSTDLQFYGERDARVVVQMNVGTGFTSAAKRFNMQREIEISSLVVQKQSDDSLKVTAVFNKLFHTGAIAALDNTYVFRESVDGFTYDVVADGDITFSIKDVSGTNYTKAVFYTTVISGDEDADYYFKVEEDLGAAGNSATSEDESVYSYVLPVGIGDVYFGALTDTVLNEFGYSSFTIYQLTRDYNWEIHEVNTTTVTLNLLYSNWTPHLSVGDTIIRQRSGGLLESATVVSATYVSESNLTRLVISKPSDWDATVETFLWVKFDASETYKRVTELTLDTGGTDSVFDILFQDGFFDVESTNINEKVKVLSPTIADDGYYIVDGDVDHVKTYFQNNFPSTFGYAWAAFPVSDFPNYTHEQSPMGSQSSLNDADIFVKDIIIDGINYKLYLWAKNSTPGGNIDFGTTIANTELKYIGS